MLFVTLPLTLASETDLWAQSGRLGTAFPLCMVHDDGGEIVEVDSSSNQKARFSSLAAAVAPKPANSSCPETLQIRQCCKFVVEAKVSVDDR